ncbi:MAG TPA: subclass B3 metallo-beta-lactamase [Amphiplicatus sp.]|nr:subclass B3 metallo-beta-lactamase [Amphiplicatus sp.]
MKSRRIAALCFAAFAALSAPPAAHAESKWAQSNPDWVEAVEPFQVIGDIYYVGSRGLSSFLITTSEGDILIDGGMPENAPMIAANIEKLGFDIKDVRILLNSHAHFDHTGGLAALKAMSGAEFIASEGDKSALEGGFYLGFENDHDLDAPPVEVDSTIHDGETVNLGGVILTAHLTPGHTRGCTSWTMEMEGRSVLFFCSASVAANRLVDPPQYQGIVADYEKTFEQTKDWRPDVFLANHPFFFGMEERRQRLLAGDENAFVDAEAFPAYIAAAKDAFEKALAEQKAQAAAKKE